VNSTSGDILRQAAAKSRRNASYGFFATHIGYLEQQYRAKGTEDGAALSLTPGQTVDECWWNDADSTVQ
jgi:hypothetical protein